jgi:hypothetical protein
VPAKSKSKGTSSLLAADMLFGAEAIAAELGISIRKAFHLLESGHLPASKTGRLWVSTRSRLRKFFNGEAAA